MQPLFEHPSEETLERFLLHQSQQAEIEAVETHILACPSCVARLEIMETHIAATKIALGELQHANHLFAKIPAAIARATPATCRSQSLAA